MATFNSSIILQQVNLFRNKTLVNFIGFSRSELPYYETSCTHFRFLVKFLSKISKIARISVKYVLCLNPPQRWPQVGDLRAGMHGAYTGINFGSVIRNATKPLRNSQRKIFKILKYRGLLTTNKKVVPCLKLNYAILRRKHNQQFVKPPMQLICNRFNSWHYFQNHFVKLLLL